MNSGTKPEGQSSALLYPDEAKGSGSGTRDVAIAGLTGGVAAWLLFLFEGRKGFNYADEGFLWYGIRFLGSGAFPQRDFQAYAPGRYLLGGWLPGAEDGHMVHRVVAYIALGTALALSSWLLKRYVSSRWLALSWLGVVVIAFVPWYRAFDHLALVGTTTAATIAADKRSSGAFASHGAAVGLALMIGFNHGLYAGVSAAVLVAILGATGRVPFRRMLKPYSVGLAVGFVPFVMVLLVVSDYPSAFAGWIGDTIARGPTNISLPLPLPWQSPATVAWVVLGTAFLARPVVYLIAGVATLRGSPDAARQALLGATAVGLPYIHHAYSRADPAHLAEAIFPAVLIVAALTQSLERQELVRKATAWSSVALAVVVAIQIMGPYHPGYLLGNRPTANRVVNGTELTVSLSEATHIDTVEYLRGQIRPGQTLFAVPDLPGVYAQLGLESPLHTTFFGWVPSDEEQESAVAAIEQHHIEWIVVRRGPLGGRDDLAFELAYPVVMDHINTEFRIDAEPGGWVVYRRVP